MEKISPALLTFLLNATWLVALVAGVASVAARLLRTAPARYRHALWVAALLLAVAVPLVNSVVGSRLHPTRSQTPALTNAVHPGVPEATPAEIVGETSLAVGGVRAQSAPAQPARWRADFGVPARLASVLIIAYTGFLLFRFAWLLRAWWLTRLLVKRSTLVRFSAAVEEVIARCQDRTRVGKVRFLSSADIAAPLTVGAATPVVVLPRRLLCDSDEAILTSAVGHELVHVQHRDYFLNLLYQFLYIPLSFHPAAALMKRRIDETRELRCDEVVTDRLLSPAAYARSLVALAGAAHAFRSSATVAVGIADADILEERIMSMLKKRRLSSTRRTLLLSAAALVFAAPCIAAAPYALRLNIQQADDQGKTNVVVPQVGPAGSTATVTRWLKKPGDSVQRDEPLLELSTGSQSVQVPAPTSGVVQHLRAGIGDSVGVNTVVASIARDSASAEGQNEEKPVRNMTTIVAGEQIGFAYAPQSGASQSEQESIARKKLEMRRRAEEENLTPEERAARQKREQEEMAARTRHLAELSKAAKITMQQAIEAALRQQQGTVMESSLIGERRFITRQPDGSFTENTMGGPQVMYRVVILSGDDNSPVRTIVLVSAADGTILKTAVE